MVPAPGGFTAVDTCHPPFRVKDVKPETDGLATLVALTLTVWVPLAVVGAL